MLDFFILDNLNFFVFIITRRVEFDNAIKAQEQNVTVWENCVAPEIALVCLGGIA